MKPIKLVIILGALALNSLAIAGEQKPKMESAEIAIQLIQSPDPNESTGTVCMDDQDRVISCQDDRVVKIRMVDSVTVYSVAPPALPTIPKVEFGTTARLTEVQPERKESPSSKHDFAIGAVFGFGAVAAAYSKEGGSGVGDENFNPMGGLRFQMDNLNLDLFLNKNTLGTGWDARIGYFILPFYHSNGIRAIFGYGERKRLAFMKEPEQYTNLGAEAIWRGSKMGFALGMAWDYWHNIPLTAAAPDGTVYSTSHGIAKISPNTMRIYANIEIVFKGKIHDSGAE